MGAKGMRERHCVVHPHTGERSPAMDVVAILLLVGLAAWATGHLIIR